MSISIKKQISFDAPILAQIDQKTQQNVKNPAQYDPEILANLETIFVNPEVRESARWLIKLNIPIVPVAPWHSAKNFPKYEKNDVTGKWQPSIKDGEVQPKFNGKNPSFVSLSGYPSTVKHKDYQNRLPTVSELRAWFANPRNGIGCLCGTGNLICIDLDAKCFEGDFEARYQQLLEQYPILKNTRIERTQSGGVHIFVRTTKNFTNFSLDGYQGKHHGEALGFGRYTVLSPTKGIKGNYEIINDVEPISIDCLESVGIFPCRKDLNPANKNEKVPKASEPARSFEHEQQEFDIKVSILPLISAKNREILDGDKKGFDNGSEPFTRIFRELVGWENWLYALGVGTNDNINELLTACAVSLGVQHKIDRIIRTVDLQNCQPAITHSDNELAIWEKFKRVHKDVFLQVAPTDIKACMPDKSPKGVYEYTLDSQIIESEKILHYGSLKNWLKKQKYTPDVVIDQAEFSYPELPEGSAVFIKSPMGTGKTQASLDKIQKEFSETGRGWFVISCRNNLLAQWVGEGAKRQLVIATLNDDGSISTIASPSSIVGLCAESLFKIQGYFSGKNVVIDELCTVLDQLLGGGTVKGKDQALAFEVFQEMCKYCRNIYFLDANLTDNYADFISQFCGDKKIIKIENIAKPRSANFTFIDAFEVDEKTQEPVIRVKDKSPLMVKLLDPSSKPWIVTDTRKCADVTTAMLMDAGKSGFNLNAGTMDETYEDLVAKHAGKNTDISQSPLWEKRHSKEIWAKDFLTDPNNFIDKYRPQFFVGSPTIECGVSFTLKGHFTEIYALIHGVLNSNGVFQFLFRNRDNEVPRYVYCPKQSLIPHKFDKGQTATQLFSGFENAIKRHLENNTDVPQIENLMSVASNSLNQKWLKFGIELEVLDVFEKNNLRACVIHKLRQAGHTVEIVLEESDAVVKENIKNVKKIIELTEATEIYEADPFETREEKEAAKKNNPGKTTARRSSKTDILEKLPGIEDTPIYSVEFFLKYSVKNPDLLTKIDNGYLLQNPEIERQYNVKRESNKNLQEWHTRKTLINKRQDRLATLRELGVDKLILDLQSGAEITKNSEVVTNILKHCRKNHKKLDEMFAPPTPNPKKDGKEIIPFIRELLDFVGVHIKPTGRKQDATKIKVAHYSVVMKPDEQAELNTIMQCIERKHQAWIEKEVAKKPEKPIEFPQELTNLELTQEDVSDTAVLTVARQLIENTCNCINELLLNKATKLLAALENHMVQMYIRTIDMVLVQAYEEMNPF
jgi:hypothetical protein